MLAAALISLTTCIEKKSIFRTPSLTIPFIAFLAVILFSLKNASHKVLVFQFFFWQSLWTLLYCSAAQCNEKERNLILKGIAFASLISGIYGALQHFGLDFFPWATQWGDRPGSTFGNPNFAAGWWGMTAPLFFSKSISEKKAYRWNYFLLTILMILNLYWGRTRGAWLALLLSSFVGGMLWFELRKKITPLISTLATVAVFGFLTFLLLRTQILNWENPSVIERQFKWATAWRMIKDYPVFGVGAGNLKVNFALYQTEVRERAPFKEHLSFRATSESNVHNEYFQIWAEMGTIGFCSFLFIFIFWYWRLRRTWSAAPPEKQLEKIGIVTAIFSFLFFSLTNFPLHIVPNACLLFFLLGISDAPEAKKKAGASSSEKTVVPTRPNYFVRSAAFILFALIFFKLIFPPLQADYLRLQAETAVAQKDFVRASALYERAIDLDFSRSERTAYYLGECYRATGQIQPAIKAYEIALQLRNYGEIYNNIGNCYYLLGNKMEAATNWATAVRLGLPDSNAQNQTEKNLATVQRLLETQKGGKK